MSWSSKKQKTNVLSSIKVEYIAATSVGCKAIWLKRILKDMKQGQDFPTIIFCDNMSSIAMTKNPIFHNRTKHVGLRFPFIRENVEEE